MAISKDNFRKALEESYSNETLFALYKTYFLDWIAEGFIGSNLGLFEISLISKTTNKYVFLDLMEQMYYNESAFINIFNSLSSDMRNIFETIAWNDRFKIEDSSLYIKENSDYSIKTKLKDEFLFFKKVELSKKDVFLTLHPDIIKVLRKYLKKPRDYYIHSVIPTGYEFQESNEKDIQIYLHKYFSFFKNEKMLLSSSGKLLKECKTNLKKYCDIQEYYPNVKDLEFLKTETIGLFLFLLKDEYVNEKFIQINNIKGIISGFLDSSILKEDDTTYIGLYLNYLKGIKKIKPSSYRIKNSLKTINEIISEFPDDDFVSLDNIIKSILYRDEFIEIIDLPSALSSIYINEANYERTKIVNYDNYLTYVVVPFIKSVFFILSSLGMLEILYDKPSSNNSLYLKNGYLNKFDGIKFVRFTELGKYVFGRVHTFEFKNLENESKLILDEDRLIVTLLGDNPMQTMFLENISETIAYNKFLITEESFIKNFSLSQEILSVIQNFKNYFTTSLPKVWDNFFSDIEEKLSIIYNHTDDYTILKLENNKKLLDIISKDKKFKSLILKAENFHIIVKHESFEELKALLKKYGYFIN